MSVQPSVHITNNENTHFRTIQPAFCNFISTHNIQPTLHNRVSIFFFFGGRRNFSEGTNHTSLHILTNENKNDTALCTRHLYAVTIYSICWFLYSTKCFVYNVWCPFSISMDGRASIVVWLEYTTHTHTLFNYRLLLHFLLLLKKYLHEHLLMRDLSY